MKLPFTLDSSIKNQIVEFSTITGLSYFIKNALGDNRRYCNLNKTDVNLKQIVSDYSTKIFNELGLSDNKEEPHFGNFIGVNSETGYVHEHRDQRCVNGFYHVRLNFLVQKPISGGIPVINNEPYDIEEGSSWFNLASEWYHSSTPVVGGTERIVLSMGRFVNPRQVDRLLQTNK